MSPEQTRGHVVDGRTDIWAFGCVVYQLLTGKLAFSGTKWTETFVAIAEKDPDWSVRSPGRCRAASPRSFVIAS